MPRRTGLFSSEPVRPPLRSAPAAVERSATAGLWAALAAPWERDRCRTERREALSPQILRRRTAAVLSALALAAGGAVLVAPTASAVTAPKVTITSGPTVTASSVSVSFHVNRQTKAVASCTYTIDGGATNTSCGAPTSAPKVNPATYSLTATSLTDGTYTLTVNVTLTDSGTASASSTKFSVVSHTAARVACAALGGTFTLGLPGSSDIWSCSGPQAAINVATMPPTGTLYVACLNEPRPPCSLCQWGFSPKPLPAFTAIVTCPK